MSHVTVTKYEWDKLRAELGGIRGDAAKVAAFMTQHVHKKLQVSYISLFIVSLFCRDIGLFEHAVRCLER